LWNPGVILLSHGIGSTYESLVHDFSDLLVLRMGSSSSCSWCNNFLHSEISYLSHFALSHWGKLVTYYIKGQNVYYGN
jgi:hypothetical protein